MHTLTLRPLTTPLSGHLRMGEPEGPDRIYATSAHLMCGDRPWFPVMGEMHFTRYPRDGWREQLLSMRADGIDVVANYPGALSRLRRAISRPRGLNLPVFSCSPSGLSAVYWPTS
ncbi:MULTISPECIES: beta-galactosidase [Streptomyces]|uniref:beta-galactosidase n=1 Tax=Streptomyces lycopersici TaxID=2974589 RepID=UPI0021D06469|nr:beta-galactosidase [Streptomyces sp. NEAU-383]